MIGTLGQLVKEIRDKLIGTGAPIPTVTGLDIPVHDYISMTYTGNNPTTVVYKAGGSSGTTVATLTMTYDASDNLLTVTKS